MATGCSRVATVTSRTRAARNWALEATWSRTVVAGGPVVVGARVAGVVVGAAAGSGSSPEQAARSRQIARRAAGPRTKWRMDAIVVGAGEVCSTGPPPKARAGAAATAAAGPAPAAGRS